MKRRCCVTHKVLVSNLENSLFSNVHATATNSGELS